MSTAPLSAAAKLGRLWRTVRWLKLRQLTGRVSMQLRRPRADLRSAPPRRAAQQAWVTPPARRPSLLGPTRMCFLAEEHDLDECGWDDPQRPLLWRYNQHYFDDLLAQDSAQRLTWHQALMARWLHDNPPARGTAWAPYPTSLRIVNWVKWWQGGAQAEPACLHSLAVQARWLSQRLEWHLLGNHLFANAKALLFAGLFFSGPEAQRWVTAGQHILQRELEEQILADGAQFERSPMYQALALEDVLDLINLIQSQAPPDHAARQLEPRLRHHASAMLYWLRCLMHPAGSLARFNDCAEGIAPNHAALEAYARALDVAAPCAPKDGVTHLQPSGYVRVARGAALGLLDLAPVGPDYLPGHAHADSLSFELSLHGQELIVNRGTSVYGDSARRWLERGTAAHSTVMLGEYNSSEVWSGFRVGRRARVTAAVLDGWKVSAAHDGYRHLRGAPVHQRSWHFEAHALTVQDRVQPAGQEPARARFHLAPGLTLRQDNAQSWRVEGAGQVRARVSVEHGQASIEDWMHALAFGSLVPAQTLLVQLQDGRGSTRWSWNA